MVTDIFTFSKKKCRFIMVDYFAKLKSGTLKASDDESEATCVSLREVENQGLAKTFRAFFIEPM